VGLQALTASGLHSLGRHIRQAASGRLQAEPPQTSGTEQTLLCSEKLKHDLI
jgi:hypothetical protein